MLTVDEAVARLIAAGRELHCRIESETCGLFDAAGRILAQDQVSAVDVPPRDNSAMDGYAFRLEDAKKCDFALPVSQRIPAGHCAQPLAPCTAARIFTGAELPDSADTVAMQEECEEHDGRVLLPQDCRLADNVRPRGQDVARGEVVLAAGAPIRAQEQGMLASIGVTQVPVFRRLRVAVLSSGDELVEPGVPLKPGQIYNSNRYTLRGVLSAIGVEMIDMGVCRDTPQAVENMLVNAAGTADVVVSTGGVSVGEEDHIKAVVEGLGQLDFWKIRIKPGKPVAFGSVGETPFIGLPGNPVSVFVTALILLRPYLLAAAGHRNPIPRAFPVPALFNRKAVKRQEYLRVALRPEGVELFPNQSSGVLSSTTWADGLAVQTVGDAIGAGDSIDYYPFPCLLGL
jgi:molybdopterin molybdotransferase